VSTGNWLLTFPRRLQPPSSAATLKMEAVSSYEMLVCINLQSAMYHKTLIFTNNTVKTLFHLPTSSGCALLFCQWQLAICYRIFNTNVITCPNTAKSHTATSSNVLDRI